MLDYQAEVMRARKRAVVALQHLVATCVTIAICLPLAVVTRSLIPVMVQLVLHTGNITSEIIRMRMIKKQGDAEGRSGVKPFYYDRQGKPISIEEWGARFGDLEYKIVVQHWVRGWKVSTVWLGLDHGFGFGPVPLIFETMVFPPGDEAGGHSISSDEYCVRYPTEEAAQAGHDQALTWIVEKIGDPAAAMEVMSAAQFGDPAPAPDDLSGLG